MIQRLIQKIVEEHLFKQKVIIIYGPRQSGKTTLSKEILSKQEKNGRKVKYFYADEISVRNAFKDEDSIKLKNAIGNIDLLVLDEAQRIENIGLKLKLLIDNFKDMQIIATGSASFDLANKINEPLTGRFYEFELLPFSIPEILGKDFGSIESLPIIERQMIFGMYPGIYFKDNLTSQKDLENLSNSYLYKDILELENIKKPLVLQKILEMIALQLGSEVNLHEISSCGLRSSLVLLQLGEQDNLLQQGCGLRSSLVLLQSRHPRPVSQ